MKRLLVAVFTAFVLGNGFTMPLFAGDAACNASPLSGEIDTIFEIECTGFDPNTHVFGYLVYPNGTASALDNEWNTFQGKTDESGTIQFQFKTRYFNDSIKYEATASLGEWALVVEQLGVKHQIVRQGIARWQVTGRKEGVNGATVAANPATVYKPAFPFEHRPSRSAYFVGVYNRENKSETTITGSGFVPGEIVTVWVGLPHGGCDPVSFHRDFFWKFFFGNSQFVGTERLDGPINLRAVGTLLVGNAKADEQGSFSGTALFENSDCEGEWRIVARGNTSGRGGEAAIILRGFDVAETALLEVNPQIVRALDDQIDFHGKGFQANETAFCWLTSPQGQAMPARYDAYFSGTSYFGDIVELDHQIKVDAQGQFRFSLKTGGYRVVKDGLNHGKPYYDERFEPWQSEGALGEWAMTCRGFESEATGIARFTLTGGMSDP